MVDENFVFSFKYVCILSVGLMIHRDTVSHIYVDKNKRHF